MNETVRKSLEQVVEEHGRYPIEAFDFVRTGLGYTVARVHKDAESLSEAERHVTGQQLAQGLREYAIVKYGVMAKAVLNHWRIYRTIDFGRIVFAMVDSKLMQKTDQDNLKDFEDVFDFSDSFDPPQRPWPKSRVTFTI